MPNEIWIGFDPRETAAFAVAKSSITRQLSRPIPVRGLVLADLQDSGVYTRPMKWRKVPPHLGLVMWDEVSGAPMATEFACSRFFVPALQERGWAMFMDCDMLIRTDLAQLFDRLNSRYAVYCVKHDYQPKHAIKMDNQIQTKYNRKLWSSFCVFNCDHPANRSLTSEMVNGLPGRDLHRFCWLEDDQIGELGQEWNWIPGHSPEDIEPCVVHFTEGTPAMSGYEEAPFSDEWREELRVWAR